MAQLAGDRGPPGVDADHDVREVGADPLDEGRGPAQLLRLVDVVAVSGLDAADVDDVRTLGHHLGDSVHGGGLVERRSLVVERVRRAVDDRHHDTRRGPEVAAAQHERSRDDRPRLIRHCGSFTRSRRLSPQRGTIGAVLWFWVVVLVALIGAVAIVATGRGDSMAEVYDDRPDASLPAGRPLNADDLRAVRLNTGVRGYRMDEVDALLARLEAEMLEREDSADVRVVTPPAEGPEDSVVEDPVVEDPAAEEDPEVEDPAVEEPRTP